ncbi:hypothetical protein Q5762_34920 [Streptomyces sp. P9(2023)]|uniref:DUF6571 family protein n=1 Tax=Streptomyces sp. P9(2023) TaxID=3064394 RepID=UPI0028F44759|nr:DUF6571 family protein [Streptomyces sp. P9(2023)]MDT9693430.1 hypothetical protein [Streptomyces sp. P9(2023)]
MTTDFGKLTTAAEKWDSMAGEIKKVEDRYKDSVQKIVIGPSWTGVSAGVAGINFAGTRYEYSAAQIQAKAIASLLRDAHTQFVDLKKKLESARAEAIEAGMNVSAQGHVTFDYARLTDSERRAYRNDPDGQTVIRESVAKWQKHIDDRVKVVSDADEGVKIALEAVVVDSNKDAFGKGNDAQLNGFNVGAQGDVEVYEARNAEDIATRINSGEKVSAADYAELNRSFRDNSDNKAFSQTFVGGIGADGTIKLANRLNDGAHSGDQSQRGLYRDVNKGLADTLAGATKVPDFKDADGKKLVYGTKAHQDAFAEWAKTSDAKFYNDFMGDLKTAGVAKYDLDVAGDKISVGTGHGQEIRGYHGLATLMQQGSGYSPQFLGDLTDDMIAAEKKDENIWDLHGSFDGKEDGWFKNDPVDGVLNVMSRDPEAATGYLDPNADGDKNRLEYLLKDRDWDTVNTTDWRGNIETTGKDTFDKDVRTGLGLALEAATTGHTPLGPGQDPWPATPHTEAQARIMHDVIGTLGPDQSVHENLREPLARSLASYTEDTHEMLAGLDSRYITEAGTGYFERDGDTHLAVSQKDLVQFMRGLSEDPEAYGTLHKAESRYIGLSLEQIPEGAKGAELTNPLNKAGTALGAMASIREDVINDGRMAGYSEADWKAKMAYHIIGGAVTPLYFTTAGGISIAFGDSIQRGVDTWAWQWGNEMKAAVDAKANPEIADNFLRVNKELPILVREWANDRGNIAEADIQGYTENALDGRDRGTGTAREYLTDTTN